MAKEKPSTKQCKYCRTEIPYDAKVCPQCHRKLKGGKLKWILLVIVILLGIGVANGGNNSSDSGTKKVGTVGETKAASGDQAAQEENEGQPDEAGADETQLPVKDIYHVGDILMDGDVKIVYMSSGEYNEENQYSQPADGDKYIYLQFAFENTSEKDDHSISFYDFECYADGYNASAYYGGEEDLSATMSAGRTTTGYLYFEVPKDAQEVEVEYETNWITEEKIKFAYEGDQNSGYTPTLNTEATPGAAGPGSTVDVGDLRITYVSCDDYQSDNMFVTPRDGYHFVSCTFEFENTGKSDAHISSYSFDCYADGVSCNQTYIREDDLTATLSAGRKTSGTVTFEVPDNATVIEAEYLSNVWISERTVFTVK
jgi:hypothetical protein